MGSTDAQLLRWVQLPLASPVIFAGIQTATVQNIAIATLAAYIGAGGLGDLILQGLSTLRADVLFAGAVPVALLAILAEVGLGRLRRLVVPVGLRTERGA
jgi:osmoprotectant transport system permease protein